MFYNLFEKANVLVGFARSNLNISKARRILSQIWCLERACPEKNIEIRAQSSFLVRRVLQREAHRFGLHAVLVLVRVYGPRLLFKAIYEGFYGQNIEN